MQDDSIHLIRNEQQQKTKCDGVGPAFLKLQRCHQADFKYSVRKQIDSTHEFCAGRKFVRHVVNEVRKDIVRSVRKFKKTDLHEDVLDRVNVEREQQNSANRFDHAVDAFQHQPRFEGFVN